MLEHHAETGFWKRHDGGAEPHLVCDYVAGLLVTAGPEGKATQGPPGEFRSPKGESGIEMLERLLPRPTPAQLRYCSARESLAAAYSVALSGFLETRALEPPNDYIVSTGDGACGAVRFREDCCVAAMISYDPSRRYDLENAIEQTPQSLQDAARDLCDLPLLNSPDQLSVSSLFWSEGGPIGGAEPWPTLYEYGGELLRRELLADERWWEEATESYGMRPSTARLVAVVARRWIEGDDEVLLNRETLDEIIPIDSPRHDDALRFLREMGFVAEK